MTAGIDADRDLLGTAWHAETGLLAAAEGSRHSGRRSLDALNFLLADVRGALGPYLNVFLVTEQHWSQPMVGWVTTVGGLLGLAAQTPIGAAIDATAGQARAVVLALAVLAIGAVAIYAWADASGR